MTGSGGVREAGARARTAAFRFVGRRAGWTLAGFVRALAWSWDYEIDGVESLAEARVGGRGVLFCFWHGRMLELAPAHADRGIGVLVSSHPDGAAAAGIIDSLGYVPIEGSRLRSPVAGVRAMLRYAEAGGDLALAPDAHTRVNRAHPGAVALARLSGHALVPVAASARPRRLVESWDRFEIPRPRARVRVRYGPPSVVPAAATPAEQEAARRSLEETLRTMHEELEAAWPERSPARGAARSAAVAGR